MIILFNNIQILIILFRNYNTISSHFCVNLHKVEDKIQRKSPLCSLFYQNFQTVISKKDYIIKHYSNFDLYCLESIIQLAHIFVLTCIKLRIKYRKSPVCSLFYQDFQTVISKKDWY